MGRLEGGLFSTISGNNNGLVFGKARTKQGKRTTVREKVIPHNPKTPKQQSQRGRFSEAVAITQAIGSGLYRQAFNNAVGALAGFQSLVSVFTNSLDSDGDVLSAPQNLNLGSLPAVTALSAVKNATEIDVTFTGGQELPATQTDKMVIIAIAKNAPVGGEAREVVTAQADTRADSPITIAFDTTVHGDAIVGVYSESSNPEISSGEKFSSIQWLTATA